MTEGTVRKAPSQLTHRTDPSSLHSATYRATAAGGARPDDKNRFDGDKAAADDSDMEYEYMDDLRVTGYDPLIPPQILAHDLPLSPASKKTIAKARVEATRILSGDDDRLIVVVGPCSVHDVGAAIEYGTFLPCSRLLTMRNEQGPGVQTNNGHDIV
jgi:hypothetical protein